MIFSLSLVVILLLCSTVLAQPPHDLCEQAQHLEIGQVLYDEDNQLASISEERSPMSLRLPVSKHLKMISGMNLPPNLPICFIA